MNNLVIDSSSKYIKSFKFKAIEPNIEINVEDESIKVLVNILTPDFRSEIEKLDLSLFNRFSSKIEYNFTFDLKEERDVIKTSINILKFRDAKINMLLSNFDIDVNKEIVIKVNSIALESEKEIKNSLSKLLKGKIEKSIILEQSVFEMKELEIEVIKEEVTKKKTSKKTKKESKVILGRDIKYMSSTLEEVKNSDLGQSVIVEGRLFNLNIIKRPNITIVSFNIDCIKDSFSFKFFTRSNVEIEDDIYVKVKATKEPDNFNKEGFCFLAKDIIKLEKEEKIEIKKERVEFNVHTKMSEMESIIDASTAVKHASKLGYKALAITDSGVVHGFPEAYKAASQIDDFKLIYGVEGFMVDDEILMKDFNKEDYYVFDIETTGFNPYREKIIEIAAVRVKAGEIVEEFSSFVNPCKSIPKEIIDLTGITDDMVKNAETIDKVLPKFLEFVKGDVVAHNAEFDMGHIKQNCKTLGLEFNNRYVDSLDISRAVLYDNKKHGLKDLAKHFNLDFRHHRALDDTRTTAKVFIELLKLCDKEIKRNVEATYPNNVLIYAKNREGLKDLYDIVSTSHLEYFKRIPKTPKSYLSSKRSNLIIGASFNNSELINAYSNGHFIEKLEEIAKFYDFIEFSPIETSNLLERDFTEDEIKQMMIILNTLSENLNIPVIATSNARYINKEDYAFVDPLNYSSNRKLKNRNQYFRDSEDLIKSFSFLENAEKIVINNTLELAKKFNSFPPVPEGFYPPMIEDSEEEVRKMTYANAHKIYGEKLPEIIEKRIEKELKAIIGNGFSVLYLISHKLVNKSLEDGYLVGSRGSVGSSFVAWLMNITEVNPLRPHYICNKCKQVEFPNVFGSGVDLPNKQHCGEDMQRDGHSIPFEIFMGFKGDKIPDVDLNFSGEYQSQVHKYVEDIFGKENVFRAGTISTLAKKNAFGYARKYFEENNIEISNSHLELYASKCENVRKTTGQHPGGMIIVPKDRSIYEFTPVQKPANDVKSNVVTTHFDYHVMDEQLVKLDILGHDDPTTLKMLEEYTGIDPVKVPINDPATISIFNSVESLKLKEEDINSSVGTFGIPEFGTPFARRMLAETKPTTFADLIRISGLSHGIDVWSNNAQNLIRDKIATLSEVISVRDDIMNYFISKGIEDSLSFKMMEFIRKGLPLKKADKWEEYKQIMKEHNVPEWYMESCKKITYMFPKGHAAAYVLMAVRIAYFKVHYPKAFYAAFLTRKVDFFDFESFIIDNSIDNIRKIIAKYYTKSRLDVREKNELYVWEIVLEMRLRGVEILPVDLYKSSSTKFLIEDNKLRAPFIVLKGLGENAAESIIIERSKPFRSFEDLRKRTKVSSTICDKAKELALFDLQDMNQSKLF